MHDTQDDTTGTYESSGATPSTVPTRGRTPTDARPVSGDGAQGAGLAELYA